MKKIQITMIHDIVCSWCPIGYSNIKEAINNLNIDVDFRFLPFEINPRMGDDGETIARYFSRQFNWSESKLLAYQKSLIEKAAKAGVVIDFSKRQYYYNTRKGHLLMHWSERFNKQTEINEKLIEAYFQQGKDISNIDVLLDIATQVGLNRDEAHAALSSKLLNQELISKFNRLNTLDLSSVPAFIVNDNTLISGSQSVEYFENELSSIINESITA